VPSFDEIFNAHVDALYAFARKRVESSEDIADLIQETFVSFIQGSEQFRQESSVLTYLTAILKYKIYDLYRKHQREVFPGDETLAELLQAPLESAIVRKHKIGRAGSLDQDFAIQDILYACIQRLKTPYYEVFVLREIDDLSTDEICKILSVSVTNLNVILFRARAQLRQMLREEGINDAH
jgi:RNA polymerase sigma factor (sigma-70 family)